MKNREFRRAAKARKIKAFFLSILLLGTLAGILFFQSDTDIFEAITGLFEGTPATDDSPVNYP